MAPSSGKACGQADPSPWLPTQTRSQVVPFVDRGTHPMQYKAHIPAGVTFAAIVTLVSGQPLDFLMLIGGGIGGALPDIDVSGEDNQGSAVQHLGTKASSAMDKTLVLSPVAKLTRPLAVAFDAIILGPACRIWRFLATKALGPAYKAIAKSGFGRMLHLDRDDPSVHRGGLTHSLFSMLLFSVPLLPLCMLLHTPQLWVGIMWGMLSHLVCDAFCKSGVKFLWPWVPNIGFRNEDGVGGKEGIKLLPAGALMKTGKCPTRSELKSHAGQRDYAEYRKYYLLEVGWQRLFQVLAVVVPVMVVLGVGPASGKIAFAGNMFDITHKEEAAALQQMSSSVVPVSESDPSVTTSDDASKVAEGRGTRVDEHKGPTSLTYGDIDASTLPAGIVKMPDESLWVAGVGRVTADTLNDPALMLTEEEKGRLLTAATWQRIGNGEAVNDAKETVTGIVEGITGNNGGTQGQAQQQQQGGSTGGIEIPHGLIGTDGDGNGFFGFHGLTPFTTGNDQQT